MSLLVVAMTIVGVLVGALGFYLGARQGLKLGYDRGYRDALDERWPEGSVVDPLPVVCFHCREIVNDVSTHRCGQ